MPNIDVTWVLKNILCILVFPLVHFKKIDRLRTTLNAVKLVPSPQRPQESKLHLKNIVLEIFALTLAGEWRRKAGTSQS